MRITVAIGSPVGFPAAGRTIEVPAELAGWIGDLTTDEIGDLTEAVAGAALARAWEYRTESVWFR